MSQNKIERLLSKIITMYGDVRNFYLTPSGSSLVIGEGTEKDFSDSSTKIVTLDSTSKNVEFQGDISAESVSGSVVQATEITGSNVYVNGKVGVGTSSPRVSFDVLDMGGSVLSQTIIDGSGSGFSCETNSTTYKQVNDDTDSSKKASITFTVPSSNKVWINLSTAIRDFDTSQALFYFRITDSDSESTQGSWGAGNFNDEQIAGYYTQQFSNHYFQWYFDGSYSALDWSPGETKTMYFQVKVQSTSEQISVKAGGSSYSPMSIAAISVPNNVNFIDMDP